MYVETKIEVRPTTSISRTCNSGRGFLFLNATDLQAARVANSVTLIFTDLNSLDDLILEAMQLKNALSAHLAARPKTGDPDTIESPS